MRERLQRDHYSGITICRISRVADLVPVIATLFPEATTVSVRHLFIALFLEAVYLTVNICYLPLNA